MHAYLHDEKHFQEEIYTKDKRAESVLRLRKLSVKRGSTIVQKLTQVEIASLKALENRFAGRLRLL